MITEKVIPVILAGGYGTRLWPMSRQTFPKQFSKLFDNHSLFQSSALRVKQNNYTSPIIITNSEFRFLVAEQLREIQIDANEIFIEPDARNTAPAILAVALSQIDKNPNSILLIMPSDHIISDNKAFDVAVKKGLSDVKNGKLVTFGIKPTRPETGYGYIEVSDMDGSSNKVKSFVEKPNKNDALKMLANGRFLWNSGIFLFSAKDVVESFRLYANDLIQPIRESLKTGRKDLDFYRLGATSWSKIQNISIDYAIMEKAKNVSVIPYDKGWSDLGGWDSVWRESQQNSSGVVTSKRSTAIDCTDTLLRSESESLEIVGVGLKNIMAIAMNDAVLISDLNYAQEVKKVVDILKNKKVKQATIFPKDHRPWGWFESLAVGEKFQVKRIHVNPGESLSLQSHKHRAEHWIVVSGIAEVTISEKVQIIFESQSVFVPIGAVHRLHNPGKSQMILIEVQTGTYLGEDDIIRYEDLYSRQ